MQGTWVKTLGLFEHLARGYTQSIERLENLASGCYREVVCAIEGRPCWGAERDEGRQERQATILKALARSLHLISRVKLRSYPRILRNVVTRIGN